MGLDLALGAIVLLAVIRGWFKGFMSQAIRVTSFVACFYLAGPVREEVRPYLVPKMGAIEPALLDRILWWVAALISYIVLLALLSLSIRLMRTPPAPGQPVSRREDRMGGMILGAAKGLVVAAFLGAAVFKYGVDLAKHFPWAERQTEGSYALKWTEHYQPVPRIWAAPPVHQFVELIRRNGLGAPANLNLQKKLRNELRWIPKSLTCRRGSICPAPSARRLTLTRSCPRGTLAHMRSATWVSRNRQCLGYWLILGAYLTLRGYHSLDGDQAYRLPLLLHAQDASIFRATRS